MKPEILGEQPAGSREPIVLDLPAATNNPPTPAIIRGDYKLIVDLAAKRYRLYNLKEDPGETLDRAAKEPDALAEMKKLYEQVSADIPYVKPYGAYKLVGGGYANGPKGPPEDAGAAENSAKSP